jgi:hypothetical protein
MDGGLWKGQLTNFGDMPQGRQAEITGEEDGIKIALEDV